MLVRCHIHIGQHRLPSLVHPEPQDMESAQPNDLLVGPALYSQHPTIHPAVSCLPEVGRRLRQETSTTYSQVMIAIIS